MAEGCPGEPENAPGSCVDCVRGLSPRYLHLALAYCRSEAASDVAEAKIRHHCCFLGWLVVCQIIQLEPIVPGFS